MAKTLFFGCDCKKKSSSIKQLYIKLGSYKKDVLNATAEVRNSCRSTCFSSDAFLCRVPREFLSFLCFKPDIEILIMLMILIVYLIFPFCHVFRIQLQCNG